MRENWRRASDSVPKRIMKKLLLFMVVIIIPAAAFILIFNIKNVTVLGATQYTNEEIRDKVITTKSETNSLILYLEYKFFRKVHIPFIEKIDVEMKNPHSVTLYVYEKRMIGCVSFLGEYLYFDKDGVVVESSSKLLEKIPQINGLKFNKVILGEKLEVQKDTLFDVILNLTQLIEKYELDVDEIRFNNSYEVTITSDSNKVLLGKKNTYDEELSELKDLLPKAKGLNLSIDLRNYRKGKEIIGRPENSTN